MSKGVSELRYLHSEGETPHLSPLADSNMVQETYSIPSTSL